MNRVKKRISFFFAIIFILSTAAISCEEKVWKPEHYFEIKGIGHVDLSSDGQEVVYTIRDGIWKGRVNNPTTHTKISPDDTTATHPRWSPNGKWIAYLSRNQQLFLLSSDGKKQAQLTDMKTEIETFRWSPDSSKIALITQAEKEQTDIKIYPKKNLGSQLFFVTATPTVQNPIELTPPDYNVVGTIDFGLVIEAFDWSPDSKKIAFTYCPDSNLDSRWKNSQIKIVNLGTQEIEELPQIAPYQSIPKFSPDGKLLAFLASDEEASYCLTRDLYLYNFSNGHLKKLAETPDESPYLVGPSILGWSADSASIFYFEPHKTQFAIYSVPINGGKAIRFDDRKTTLSQPLLNSNRKWLGFVSETSQTAPEAYVTSTSKFAPIQVSHANKKMEEWKMAETKAIQWKSSDGTEIEGLLTYPKRYNEKKSYPLILLIHGGPMGFHYDYYLGKSSIYPLAALADAGFAILRPNLRGSCGYGKPFRYANQFDWGGGDFQDLMCGIDTLVQQGIADPNRLGIMGWSFGGYMTAWAITQTDRFKAASMGGGICNLVSFGLTTDIIHFMSDYMNCELWKDCERYIERSPIFYVDRISTPLLIQHGELDERVSFSQSREFYQALRKLDKPVSMATYPRSSHVIIEPKLHLDALQRNFDWFNEHIGDKQ